MKKYRTTKEIKGLLNLLVIFVIVLLCFSEVATACPDPECDDCFKWNGEKCVWVCGSGDCCSGSCCYTDCCDGTCCASGQTCCGECCDPADCCGGECCTGRECCNNTCCDMEEECCLAECCDDRLRDPCEIYGPHMPAEECCNGTCCNNHKLDPDDPFSPPIEHCCTDIPGEGNGYCCPNGQSCCEGDCYDSQTQGCCDGTVYNLSTQKCCDGLDPCDTDYICDIDETCCDGLCVDPTIDQCCDDIGGYNDGYSCPSDKICCNGNCCESYQCCIDDQCVDPICDNCHSISSTLYECGHREGDTECATNWCIKNVLSSATCDHKGDDWPCTKSRCNTRLVTYENELTQYEIVYLGSGSCPGGTVNFVPWETLYYGCRTCSSVTWTVSCETSSCSGSVEYIYDRGHKKKCGCV